MDKRQLFDLRLMAELITVVALMLGGLTAFIQTQDAVIALKSVVEKNERQQKEAMRERKEYVDKELLGLRVWAQVQFTECREDRAQLVNVLRDRFDDKFKEMATNVEAQDRFTREILDTKLNYYIPIITASARKLEEGDRFTQEEADGVITRVKEIGTEQDEVQRLNERQDARLDHLENSVYGSGTQFRFRRREGSGVPLESTQ